MKAICRTLLFSAGLLVSSPFAAQAVASSSHEEPHGEEAGLSGSRAGKAGPTRADGEPFPSGHHEWVFGTLLTSIGTIPSEHEGAQRLGVGLFAEVSLVPHWLELELATRLMAGPGVVELPVELLAKLPFALAKTWTVYLGAGPVLVPAFVSEAGESAAHVHVGVSAVLQSYWWFAPQAAAIVELGYGGIAESHFAHELTGSVGFAYGL